MNTVRAVGKGVRGCEPYIPQEFRVLCDLIDAAVPHPVTEKLRCRTISTVEWAASAYLYAAVYQFRVKSGVFIQFYVFSFSNENDAALFFKSYTFDR